MEFKIIVQLIGLVILDDTFEWSFLFLFKLLTFQTDRHSHEDFRKQRSKSTRTYRFFFFLIFVEISKYITQI